MRPCPCWAGWRWSNGFTSRPCPIDEDAIDAIGAPPTLAGVTENDVLGVATSTRGERGRPCSYGPGAGIWIGVCITPAGARVTACTSAAEAGKRSGTEKLEAVDTILLSIVVSMLLLMFPVAPVETNEWSMLIFMLLVRALWGVLGSAKPAARETSP